jgi:hypothetical protein
MPSSSIRADRPPPAAGLASRCVGTEKQIPDGLAPSQRQDTAALVFAAVMDEMAALAEGGQESRSTFLKAGENS